MQENKKYHIYLHICFKGKKKRNAGGEGQQNRDESILLLGEKKDPQSEQ